MPVSPSDLPTYDQWMKSTYSALDPRSEALKTLDAAIKTRQVSFIKTSLDKWIDSQKPKPWRKSVRNKDGAVTELYRLFYPVGYTPEDLAAIRYVTEMAESALKIQLAVAKLQFKESTWFTMRKEGKSSYENFKSNGKRLLDGTNKAYSAFSATNKVLTGVNTAREAGAHPALTELLKTACGSLSPHEVLRSLELGSPGDLIGNLTPVLGLAKSGVKVALALKDVVVAGKDQYTVRKAESAVATGDPLAAYRAVVTLLNSDTKNKVAKLGTATAEMSARALASAFLDGGVASGPIISACAMVVDVIFAITAFVADTKECTEANRRLLSGPLDRSLFTTSPILGCYYLVIQDHSTIVACEMAKIGNANWTANTEALVAQTEAARERARDFIHDSRLEIPNMERFKGIVKPDFTHQTTLGKITGLSDTIKNKITRGVDEWVSKRVG